jgi:hypothetical protein
MSAQSPRPRSVHTADGGIVFDISKGSMFSLNSSGSVIFQLLEKGLPEEDIVEELVKRFGIAAELARRDFADFCTALKNHALLLTSSDGTSE